MAKSLKTNGLKELRSLIRRVERQHALQRITTVDKNTLLRDLKRAEAHIVTMKETQEEEESWL